MDRKRTVGNVPDPEAIDALYGLEPVLEPGMERPSGSEPTVLVSVDCPYCGESFGTVIDLSAGSSSYIEDCQVCCQPIELRVTVDEDGNLRDVEAVRTD
jgi:hypothetical protein